MQLAISMLVTLTGIGLVSSGCEDQKAARQRAAKTARFDIQTTSKAPEDGILATFARDSVVLDVRNQFGIGSAEIGRPDDGWPAKVVLRLHLKGLESLRLSSETMELSVSVSSHDARQLSASLRRGNDVEHELTKADSAWPALRIVGEDGQPGTEIPLDDGYFEALAPAVLFEGNPKSITLRWIDFFRG